MRIRFVVADRPLRVAPRREGLSWGEYEDLPYLGVEAIGYDDDFIEDDPHAGIDWGDHGNQ